MEGILLTYKPSGLTSREFLNNLGKILKAKKIGHGGSLDKFAQGLLIVGIGEKFTKKLNFFLTKSTKEYLAEIELGKFSFTDDPEGPFSFVSSDWPPLREIKKILNQYPLGEILVQKVPACSAKKIQGKRLSDLLREGKLLPQKTQKVIIYQLELLKYKPPLIELKLKVSSGFYVRAFAREIGEALKTGAYLKNLTRIKIDEFEINQAIRLEELEKEILELKAQLFGRVQGVSFRAWTDYLAKSLNIKGEVKNLPDGSVSVIAQSFLSVLADFQEEIKKGPPLARVEDYDFLWKKPLNFYADFSITY